MNTCNQKLIIFTRYPLAGKTKTRMIPAIGPESAAELQRQMTQLTVANVQQVAARTQLQVEVRFAGGNWQLMTEWLGGDIIYTEQGEGDLGQRISSAFKDSFFARAGAVVIIGTDCPDLSPEILRTAFVELKVHDLVIGPASDGGYYLIGLKFPQPELFLNISWGTDKVLAETLAIAEMQNLSHFLLQVLNDVDRPDDLHLFERAIARHNLAPLPSPHSTLNVSISAIVSRNRRPKRDINGRLPQ